MAKILIIDDDAGVRKTIRLMLVRNGHEALEAENGRVGLEMMRQHRPPVVITDILMPTKEGIETIIEMRREAPDIRIIAISGGGRTKTTDFLTVASKFGAFATLNKPFRMDEIVKLVDDALRDSGAS